MGITPNPILQALSNQQSQGVNQNLNQVKSMVDMIRNARDPNAMLMSLANQNPQLGQVMSYINQSGGDPKMAFYAMAKEKGINPDDVIAMLR